MTEWRDVAEPGNTVSTPHFLSSFRLLLHSKKASSA